MTGVKGYIRDNLPPSWEKALLDNKALGKFIDQFYNAIVKEKNKNKYHYKVTIMNARYYLKSCSIQTIAVGFNFKEGEEFWFKINQDVINYESRWK